MRRGMLSLLTALLVILENAAYTSASLIEANENQQTAASRRAGLNSTTKEFVTMMNGYKRPEGHQRPGDAFDDSENVRLPKNVDWRKKGAVTKVKNQGFCGACWAFSATGSLEGQQYLKSKKLVSLSEQNLVDCSTAEGNSGCHGGFMNRAFSYVQKNNGIDTEASYPYEGNSGTCRYNPKNNGATDNGYVIITSGSEKALQKAVATIGPISVAIDDEDVAFQHYKSGVYQRGDCSSIYLNHAVLAVGYGSAKNGGDYWLVKNSWGRNWGMNGYIMMARNQNNMCGIATMASYPKLRDEVTSLRDELADRTGELEQYKRRNNISIFGVKEAEGESTECEVVKFCRENLGIKLPAESWQPIVSVSSQDQHRMDEYDIDPSLFVSLATGKRTNRWLVYDAKKKNTGVTIREDLTFRHVSCTGGLWLCVVVTLVLEIAKCGGLTDLLEGVRRLGYRIYRQQISAPPIAFKL
ncbi:hypothetical protein J6590_059867 [Homalodisca vitripennis]|nr:hypothetical protein J6590_059867 [Homalodisca vitripennis]